MNKNNWIVLLILCIWFVISFVTNILGPMLPMIIDSFGLSLTLAAFLPFSFFLGIWHHVHPGRNDHRAFRGKDFLIGRFQSDVFGCGAFRHVPDLPYRIDLPFRYRSGHGDATGDYIALDA